MTDTTPILHEPLDRACKKVGGQNKMAGLLGVAQSTLWHWIFRAKRGVPAHYVLKIEAASGVSRHELRPDVFPQAIQEQAA